MHSLYLSKVDYCNSLFIGLPKKHLRKLQKLINASVCFIFNIHGIRRQRHISPYLKRLHFVPIEHRINFKISILTFKCLNKLAPSYLKELLCVRVPLRASDHILILSNTIPRINNDFFHA